MRTLSFDPGGEKLGWACLDSGPRYVASGVSRWPRAGQQYQPYRMYLTAQVRSTILFLLDDYEPEKIVTEIVPAIGSVGFMSSGQGYIANVVATTIHNVAMADGVPIEQISARSWEKEIALRPGGKSKKITKAQIRNGVLEHLPDLRKELSEHLMEWDRWDALGMGLVVLGCVTK